MGYIIAGKIREAKTAKAIAAWEKSDKPSSEVAEARMSKARNYLMDTFGNLALWGHKPTDTPEKTKARIAYYVAKNVWIGALHAEGKSIFHLT